MKPTLFSNLLSNKLLILIKKSFNLIEISDKRKVLFTIPVYMLMSIFDLIGVVILGSVGAMAYNIATGSSSPTKIENILSIFLPQSYSRNQLVLFLAFVAVLFLCTKTLAQAIFSFKFSKFMANLETKLSSSIYKNIFNLNLSTINIRAYSDYQSILMIGTNRLINGVIGSTVLFLSDLFTTTLMFIFAFYAAPYATLSIIFVFAFSYTIFNGPINRRADRYGEEGFTYNRNINENLLENLRAIKEIKTYKIRSIYEDQFIRDKYNLSMINQKSVWLNSLVRYFLEFSILLSGILVAFILVITTDLKHALTISIILLVIGFRLIPNIQRMQNSYNSLRIANGATIPVFDLLEAFIKTKSDSVILRQENKKLGKIIVKDLCFKYQNGNDILQDISFELLQNKTLVILGPSGSGKTTLIDLLIGLLEPTSGKIMFLNDTLSEEIHSSNTGISYISQNCALIGNDLYQNISLTKNQTEDTKYKIDKIIQKLNLEYLNNSENNRFKDIRSDSTNVSGGERQRISIARAIYFDKGLVILDEPTSSLDYMNKRSIIDYIKEINGIKTVILVTHDSSLIEISDYVLNLSHGKQLFFGTTDEFRNEN